MRPYPTRVTSTTRGVESPNLAAHEPGGQEQRGAPLSHSARRKGRKRRRVQVVLTFSPGAEPWILVEHAKGTFRLPASTSVLDAYTGALEAWTGTKLAQESERYVPVPLPVWRVAKRLLANTEAVTAANKAELAAERAWKAKFNSIRP